MTAYTEHCSRSLVASPAGALESLSRSIRCWFEYQQLKRQVAKERRQLLTLTDSELKDLGITRDKAELEARRRDLPSLRIR